MRFLFLHARVKFSFFAARVSAHAAAVLLPRAAPPNAVLEPGPLPTEEGSRPNPGPPPAEEGIFCFFVF
jgi:hypothetical protein